MKNDNRAFHTFYPSADDKTEAKKKKGLPSLQRVPSKLTDGGPYIHANGMG